MQASKGFSGRVLKISFSKVHKTPKRLRNTVLRAVGFNYNTPDPEWRWRQCAGGQNGLALRGSPAPPPQVPSQGPLFIDACQLNLVVHHGHRQNLLTDRIVVPTLTQTCWIKIFKARNQLDQKSKFLKYLMVDLDTAPSLGTRAQRTPCFVSSRSWFPLLVLPAPCWLLPR